MYGYHASQPQSHCQISTKGVSKISHTCGQASYKMFLYIYAILLFSGTDYVSQVIQDITGSEYSHVGLLLKDRETDQSYVFESTGSFSQIAMEYQFPQVQIHRLETVIAAYPGKIVQRVILNRNADLNVEPYITPLLGTSYERHIAELLRALARDNTKENETSLFCSELVAKTLRDHGLLILNRLTNNYMPKDFSEKEDQDLKGLILGPEIQLNRGDKPVRTCCVLY